MSFVKKEVPPGTDVTGLKTLRAAYERISEERTRLKKCGVEGVSTMSHIYNQFVDGKISGVNLALSLINEEIQKRNKTI